MALSAAAKTIPAIATGLRAHASGVRWLGTLVVAEQQGNGKLSPFSLSAVTAAQQLGQPVTALLMGHQLQEAADSLSQSSGVSKVMLAQHPIFERPLAEPMSALLQAVQYRLKFDYVLAPGSSFGKNLLPRAAALLGCQPLSEVVQVVSPDTFVRPAFAGNALLTKKYTVPGLRMMTVRTTAFSPAVPHTDQPAPQEAVHQEDMSTAESVAQANTSTWVSESTTQTERPDLTSADVVVCGGRALKDVEGFKKLESLADAMGGAVGATRAAVDAGMAPNELQVGQTGKVVAPKIYFGIGVSGAIQHMAGIKDSQVIVAINSDPEAPMFKESDYALVGDLFHIVPELEQRARQLKGGSA